MTFPQCPDCSCSKVWKDGLRETRKGYVQRYICRSCGLRFSENSWNGSNLSDHVQKIDRQILNFDKALPSSRQVCVTEAEGMINLATVETRTQEKAQRGATAPDPATIKGLVIQFAFWLEKKGDTNSPYPDIIKRLARRGANLLDPESVKEVVAKATIKNGTKVLEVYAYDALAKMLNIQWERPHYVQEEHLPFIPEEKELDQLIAACRSKRMVAFLQTLKETFADPGEALKSQWTDLTGNTLSIRPVKGHRPRQLTISNKLVAMLNSLPRKSERIFPTTYDSMYPMFSRLRKRVATTLQNPRIKAISFNTFRHWGGTMTYHQTRNILLVQKILGHKCIENTMKYTQLVCFQDNDYDVATATTIEEDQQLLKVGFEYVTERNDIKIYRRPKTFAKLQS